MRTITKTYNVYQLNELNKEAQGNAIENLIQRYDYPYWGDNNDVLNEFCKLFDISVEHYGYIPYSTNGYGFYFINRDYDVDDLRGVRLYKYIYNNYSKYLSPDKMGTCLTGYYLDDIILDPILKFLERPKNITFRTLINKCIYKYTVACREDYDYCQSLEHLDNFCTANNIEFLDNGDYA